MINQEYKKMLGNKSIIRELSEFATARAKVIGAENVFDYSLGNPSVSAPASFNEEMIRLLSTESSLALHGYSPSLGIESVRKAVAESLNKRFDMNYETKHIFMTSGAAGAVAHAVRCVGTPGEDVLVIAPYFTEYVPYIEGAGLHCKVVAPDYTAFQINFELLEQMITKNTAAILLNTPNNPTGVSYSSQTLTKLADLLEAKQKEFGTTIFIISDEPYREITFLGVEKNYVAKFYKNTITCYSFSKSLSVPGERIGYVAVRPEAEEADIIALMCGQISRGTGHNCPASLVQLALTPCLYDTSDLSVYETNMNLLYNKLTELGFDIVKPGGTFYMFPKALEHDSMAFCKKATKYELILVPGAGFGAEGYFRIAYCTTTDKVIRSLDAFEKFVKSEY